MSEYGNALFDALVAASGLSPLFGNKALSRALARAGLDPRSMQRRDIERALPAIEQALTVFLKPHELPSRLESIAQLGRGLTGSTAG